MGDVALFDLTPDLVEVRKPKRPEVDRVDWDALEAWAFLYTATALGNNSGIRFLMPVEDAQRWCESGVSQGVMHGTPWAYFWTTVRNFLTCHWGGDGKPEIDARQVVDNGSWDERIADAGCEKYGIERWREALEPHGIRVLR